MNIEVFLAQKIKNTKGKAFSSTVLKVGVISVALGVAVIILSFAVLIGFKETIKEKLFSVSSHFQVSKITLNQSFEEVPFVLNSELIQNLQNNPNVEQIVPIIQKSAIAKSETEINGVLLKGLDLRAESSKLNENIVEGRALQADSSSYSKEIVLSARQMKLLDVNVGDEILIYFIQNPPRARKLKIVGKYDTGIPELDLNYALVDIDLIRRINNWGDNEVGHLEIFVKDFKKLDATVANAYENLPQELVITPVTRLLPQFFDWFNLLDRNIVIIIILIIAVAGFNMISVLLIMIMERTPMVGLLKALGTSTASIRKVFAINAIDIILKGLLYGNAFAIAFCLLQYYFKVIPLEQENYYMSYMPIHWDWSIFFAVNIGTLLSVALFAFLPTFTINKISPVKALKYKD